MSQSSNKIGLKKLSTKRCRKLTKETKTSNDELTQHFNSFISLSSSNQDGHKDDSLINVGSITKNTSPKSQTDYFKFTAKTFAKESCLETTLLSPVATSLRKDDVNASIPNETCSKYVRVSDLFNDSSLLFQDNANSFNKNKINENNSEPIIVKALSKTPGPSEDHENELNTSSEDNVAIPNMIVNRCVSTSDPKVEESAQSVLPETIQQCPICLKTVSKYLSHMKSCAAKNKLNTQQLLSALQLHKKQLAERKELGLHVPVQSFRAKVSPKRSKANDKGPRDANLQLALALSASLRSAEEDELIQEAEALKVAGLTSEAHQKLSTLEQFGFASDVAPQPRSLLGSSKSRPLPRSLLLERSKEERERIVTEKIAIVLISEEENVSLDIFDSREPKINSKLLKKAWDKDCELWVMAHCEAEVERSKFYVDQLLEFVSPCKTELGAALRRLSQLPGRFNTPERGHFFDAPSTPNSSSEGGENIYELPTPSRWSVGNVSIDTVPTVQKSSLLDGIKHKLSEDWKLLVNNPELSDLEIQCEDGKIPAHRLVFHVRWPKVLQNIDENNDRRILVLKNCSKTAVLAILEFVYAGSLERISWLKEKDFKSLSGVVDQFDFTDLKTHLRRLNKTKENVSRNESKSENFKQGLFRAKSESQNDLNGIESLSPCKQKTEQTQRRKSLESHFEKLPEPELCPTMELESTRSSCGRGSPDMFDESNKFENKSFSRHSQNDLDMLASLVGKTTGVVEGMFDDPDSSKTKNNLVVDSPSGSLVNESSSGKRKALESSGSEELSLSKRPCSEWSKRASLDNLDEDIFDLTQSSNSNECITQNSCQDIDIQLSKKHEVVCLEESNDSAIKDDSMEGLTQKDPSLPNSPCNISSASKKTPKSQNKSPFQDYFEPAWDGYEDYLHFNYTPITTPLKPLEELSTGKKSSQNTCSQKKYNIACIKTNVEEISLLTPKTSVDVNYISCDSSSPKQSTLKVLHECSRKSNIIASESLISQKPRGSPNSQEIATYTTVKYRKNLSSQFNTPNNSPIHSSPKLTPNINISQTSNSGEKSLGISSCKSDDDLKRSPLKTDSLIAMQHLLDDSFDINDSVLANADAILAEEAKSIKDQISHYPSTSFQSNNKNKVILERNKNSVMTPPPEIIASDNVTPLPNYSAMKTPSLKRELSKFGLKPSLGKQKAKLLLRYIYDQTHPFVADPGGSTDEQVEEFKQPTEHPPRSPMKSLRKSHTEVNRVDSESDTEESYSQQSTSTVSSSATLPEESLCEFEDVLTQDVCSVGDLKTAIRSLIVNNADLHRRVLLYEPIFLDEFMAILKANGVKCKVNDVMDYLDEQCITFRTNSWKTTNEKRRQKNLKKKAKSTARQNNTPSDSKKSNANKSNGSPSKEQPNPVKKRGRPRKNRTEQDSSNQ